jgi:hypothetical protein
MTCARHGRGAKKPAHDTLPIGSPPNNFRGGPALRVARRLGGLVKKPDSTFRRSFRSWAPEYSGIAHAGQPPTGAGQVGSGQVGPDATFTEARRQPAGRKSSLTLLLPSLYEILEILSLNLFERIPVDQLLAQTVADDTARISDKQLILFE